MTRHAWRRRVLVAASGANILEQANRIMAEQALERDEAIAAVFADPALLAQAHQVAGVQVPDMPVSPIVVQNKFGG